MPEPGSAPDTRGQTDPASTDDERLTVRAATPQDDRALAALDAEAWPPELWVVPPQPAEEPFFSDRREPADVLVAQLGDTILGYARLSPHMRIDANAHVLHLSALAVSPLARRMGVGSALVDATIAEARRRGARKLGLRALSTNLGAIALYERHGFVEEGRLREEIRLHDGSLVDDVWMALALI